MAKDFYAELRDLFDLKKTVDSIKAHQSTIEDQLKRLERHLLGTPKGASKAVTKGTEKKTAPKAKAPVPAAKPKRGSGAGKGRLSLPEVVVQVMRDKKAPLSVDELADIILKGKLYISASKNFKNNLRVILYRNKKEIFKRVSAGMFQLTEGTAKSKPAAKKAVAPAKAGKAKTAKPAKKKTAAKKSATKKATAKETAAAKKATVKKSTPKKKTAKKKAAKKKA